MSKSVEMGTNRTGVDMSPVHHKEMTEAAQRYEASETRGGTLETMRRQAILDADPLGSVPLPGTGKGMLSSMAQKLAGKAPEMLLSKLGERLAYERSGVRIYESFLIKCEAANEASTLPTSISLEQIRQFHQEERAHFDLLTQCLESLGADPTTQTPDADVTGVASMGLMKVITDPRTTLAQCLEAMLSVELIDNAEWELLVTLAQDMEMDEMREQFLNAAQQEAEHLRHVRAWYEEVVRGEASAKTH